MAETRVEELVDGILVVECLECGVFYFGFDCFFEDDGGEGGGDCFFYGGLGCSQFTGEYIDLGSECFWDFIFQASNERH